MIEITSLCVLSSGYASIDCLVAGTKMQLTFNDGEGNRILDLAADMIEAKLENVKNSMTRVARPALTHIPLAEPADDIPF